MSAKTKAFLIGCIFFVSSIYTLTQQAPNIALTMFLLGVGCFAIWGFLYAHGRAQVNEARKMLQSQVLPRQETPTMFVPPPKNK